MKLKAFFLGLLLCCYTCVAFANVPLMPIQDLKPGMQGIGKTVIKGDTIEEFNVEILGVSGSETAGYSILVRLYGDLIEKTGGVAQGMSGSPVYVDGRLVGAVAFGKTFNDPHYCFLTPIHNMLKLIDMPVSRSGDWLPKGTGLMAGGFTPMGMEYLQEKLQAFGLEAVAGGGSGSESIGSLEPGSAVAASLMQGDLTLGSLGTVTWTDDKGNVLAFGHPFMQRGECNFFMNKVWILGCIPNMQSSYKVGNIGEVIGTFNQDRASGIGGKEGKAPASIPVFVSVSDTGRGQNTAVRVRIIEDEKLVPAILDAVVYNTVTKTMDRNGGGTARLHFEISGVDKDKNLVTIDRENMYYASDGLSKLMNLEMVEAANILSQNKFEKIDIYGITVTAEITDDVQVAEITQVSTPKRDVKPGDKVPFEVTLKPYRGEEFTKTTYFTVPKNHPGGRLALSVRGGSSLAWAQKLLRKQQEEGMPVKEKEAKVSLGDFIKKMNEADKNNELIIDLASGVPSAMQAEAMPEAGLAGILQGTPYKQKKTFDFIIDGDKEIVLNVDK
ncbi:MAG: hypothetical protein IJC05_03515 [Phascolarctobacterium sp.]|nr:hypothetical protein [Phascolarctobacterium sp.]